MSESDDTGYRESPATTDGPVGDDQTDSAAKGSAPQGSAPEGDATLTTDADAQGDDGVARPGNAPD
jgi:hypothetical protein